jgi:hypothetical protein
VAARPQPSWVTLFAAVLLAWAGVATAALQTTGAAFSQTTVNAGNSFQAAASFCGATTTVTADADAALREQQPTTNFGTATALEVRSQNNGRNRRSLVHFTLPALPPGCAVASATLRLFTVTLDAGDVYQAFAASGAWTEGTVTWNTQPSFGGTPATATTAAGWMSWTVTTQVNEMYAGSNDGFLVKDQTEGGTPPAMNAYSSREGGNPPQLVITFG